MAVVVAVAALGILVFRAQSPKPAGAATTTRTPTSKVKRTGTSSSADLSRHTADQEVDSVKKWSAILFDTNQKDKMRRQAAFELAKIGTQEAVTELRLALKDPNPVVRGAVAEAFGACPNPEAHQMLKDLIGDKDDVLALGAARGFVLRGDQEAIQVLTDLINSNSRSVSLRADVADALGGIKDPAAFAALVQAANSISDPHVLMGVLQGIGQRSFTETKEFYQEFLAKPGMPTEARVAAIESIGNAQGATADFLLQYAKDPDPEVRAGAAWALSNSADSGKSASEIIGLLNTESDNAVRLRLYQALSNQDQVDPGSLMKMVQNEVNSSTRLAGWDALSSALDSQNRPEVTQYFNQTAVPELKNTALTAASEYERLAAAMALRKAHTSESLQALKQISSESKDPRVSRVAQGSPRRTNRSSNTSGNP